MPRRQRTPPEGAASGIHAGKAVGTLMLFGALAVSVVAAAVPTLVVPHFAEMLRNFGAELPLLTRLVMDYAGLLWAIPVVTLLIWRLWPDRTQGLVLALGFALAMLLGLVPLLIVALYLPIFNLGASVG